MRKQHVVAGGIITGGVVVLSAIAFGVARYPAGIAGSGISFLWMDVALLLLYGFAGFAVWNQSQPAIVDAATIGARFGVALGFVLVANHAIESFVTRRSFVLVIGPVFLGLAFLAAAGSAGWMRSRPFPQAIVSGVVCAIVGVLIGLSSASWFNLLFENYVELQQRAEFAASGQSDPGGYLVNNILESASEILLRMPIFAVVLSFAGAALAAVIGRLPRAAAIVASCLAPVVFAAGAYALWYADALDRSLRPPFIMAGVMLAGIGLCAAHPIWSAVTSAHREK